MQQNNKQNKVLIIDNDDEIRRFLIILLISEDFDVDFASNGLDAISKIHQSEYGAILCEINLPDMDGMSLLRKLKKSMSPTETIMISHKNNLSEAINALRLGAFDYLLKPFENIDLITSAINKALASFAIKKQNQELIKELTETNENLASLVHQKTASLSKSNEELMNATSKLIKMQETLLEEKKLSSLGSITAGFAHEINNPIQNIMIYSELLLRSLPLESGDHNFAKIINIEVERIATITNKILNYSRKSSDSNKEHIDLKKFFTSLFDENYNQLSAKKIQTYNDTGDNQYIFCDKNELHQIFLNMMINSIDAMDENGIIQVKTKKSEDNLDIFFSDSGMGIPKDLQSRIFEPFFTTKEVGKGTGLGLYITYNLIKKNKGQISLCESTSQGSTFKLQFPVD